MAIDNKYLHSDITSSVLQAFYNILKKLPIGLPIDIYKRTLEVECEFLGLKTERDKEINILHRQKIVGSFLIDLVINDCVILNIIRNETIDEPSVRAAKNQLRLSEYEVCLILDIDQDGMHKRLVYTNDLKTNH